MVCNDVSDCPDGDDELKCDMLTCVGLLRCTLDRLCVHPAQVCDGVVHCPKSEDDERICRFWFCPVSCLCIGYIVHCRQMLPNMNDYNSNTKGLIMRGLTINRSYALLKIHKVLHLDLSTCVFEEKKLYRNLTKSLRLLHVLLIQFCKLKVIEKHSFQDLQNLLLLDVMGNYILQLNTNTWNAFVSLPNLDFNQNELTSIDPLTFDGLIEVKILNLSYNKLFQLHMHTFVGLPKLIVLDISYNPILHIEFNAIYGLDASIIVSDILLCCYSRNLYLCRKQRSGSQLTSNAECPKIFNSNVAQSTSSCIGVLLLLTNIGSMIYNYKSCKQETNMLMITHLYVADTLSVLYVLGMSSISSLYSHNYIYIAIIWKETYFCHVMNALLLCGGLLSKSTMCLIAINQLLGTKYALTIRKISKYHFLGILICIWAIVGLYVYQIVMTKQSIYTITCSMRNNKDGMNSNIIFAHWIYIIIMTTLTTITAVIFQQITSHVKESSSRVRSTRNVSKVYQKLARHTILNTVMEIATLSASCYLLVHSCFYVDKPSLTAVLCVAYVQASLHACFYAVRPIMSHGISMVTMKLTRKADK